MKLDLEAKNKPQELIKKYLEENVSEELAKKINDGVPVEKDGKTLINRKTMDGAMKYAAEEARKQAEKGAKAACVEDSIVYGWAVHYFEEDSITEKLYNEDGSVYAPAKPAANIKKHPEKLRKTSKPQMSLFELMNEENKTDGEETAETEAEEVNEDDDREEAAESVSEADEDCEYGVAVPEISGEGKHWIDDRTYADEDGVIHDIAEETPEDETLMRLKDIFAGSLTVR